MAGVKMFPVKSSNISSVGFDHVKQHIHVQFNSGQVWGYKGVTKKDFNKFLNSKSKGSHFYSEIKSKLEGFEVEL